MKNQYKWGLGQFANLRGGLGKKVGGLIFQWTLCYELNHIMRLLVTFISKIGFKTSDKHWETEVVPLTKTQSWLWESQVADQKQSKVPYIKCWDTHFRDE